VGSARGNHDYRETFFTANPGARGRVWVHHAVEWKNIQKRYPGLFTLDELHSLENLRGIPIGANNRLHLSTIRTEWNSFYRANPATTRQQVLDFATRIDDTYGHRFLPRIR
jgi:hypothetical protein